MSYTGRLDLSWLQQANNNDDQTQSCSNPTPHLTKVAQVARSRLRWAESLKLKYDRCGAEKKLSKEEYKLLQDLKSGKLRDEAHEATRKSGFGRIKHTDGTTEDISRHGGGVVRSILASFQPEVSLDVDEATEEDPYGFCDFSP